MSPSPRRTAAVAAGLVAFALLGGPVAAHPPLVPQDLRVVALRQAAPIDVLAAEPSPTPGVPEPSADATARTPAGTALAATARGVSAAASTRASAAASAAAAAAAAAAQRRALAARPVGKVVALTFDDGPDSRWTPQVLALLARYHAHATFCVIGREVRTREWMLRAVLAQGHTLCNHSWSHDEHLATRARWQVLRELQMTDDAIRRATGSTAAWFRAPGGAWAPALDGPLAATHLTPLDWTVDPRDWDEPGPAAIVARVLAGLRPGAVVDLHDGGGNRWQTVAALRVLLPALAARGYTCVPVTAALAARTL